MMQFVFVHIPKTAGMSTYIEISKYIKPAIRFGNHEMYQKFLSLPSSQLKSYSFISGHISLPHFRRKEIVGPAFAVVRDPFQRMLSTYFYINRSEHPDHRALELQDFDNFLDYIESTGNWSQCGFICEENNFESAIDMMMEDNVLISPLEQYDNLMRYLRSRLGCPLESRHENKASKKPNLHLSEKQVSRIDSINEEDTKLYNYVLAEFEEQLKVYSENNKDFFDSFRSRPKVTLAQ